MPKYVYQGLNTGVTFELEQRISESALTHHPETNEPVKRLIGRPAISFKGSGFYANDSKSSASSDTKAAPASDTKTSDSKTDASGSTSSDASATIAPAKEASSPAATPTAAPAKSAD
jgi:predicted nucleic acid-binding Zn ribbon protein